MNSFRDRDAAGSARSDTSLSPSASTHSAPSRTSLLPSVKIPYLRRFESRKHPPPITQQPLLTLKLSSPSFLDSFVKDDLSKLPLYTIRTSGTSTTIIRNNDYTGEMKTAEITWPKALPPTKDKGASDGVLIRLRGERWKGGETLLKHASGSRKFSIPNYSHNLKWKRVGQSYWCTTAQLKGRPIAVLEGASRSEPPKLVVYETLHEKNPLRSLYEHQGVSILLLDHLLITALLLVTDVQEWMVVRKFEGKNILIPNIHDTEDGPRSASDNATSASQWRKIMFGEPIFPKLSGEMLPADSSTSMPPTASDPEPPTPTSDTSDTMPQFVYRNSIDSRYTTNQTSTLDLSSSSGESDEGIEQDLVSPPQTRPPSPSAESIFYPLTNSSAPSHTYLDPSFYNPHNVPPVPPLPLEYRRPGSSQSSGTPLQRSISPASATSSGSRFRRDLPPAPQPPPPPPPLIFRPRSTPPRDMLSHNVQQRPSTAGGAVYPLAAATTVRRPSDPGTARSRVSISSRPLPRPPQQPSEPLSPVPQSARSLRHIQSSSSIAQDARREDKGRPQQRSQRSLPPTPMELAAARTVTAAGVPVLSASTSHQPAHRRLRSKTSEEDFEQWMTEITGSRGLPQMAMDMPRSSVIDVPPPSYYSIFDNGSNGENQVPTVVNPSALQFQVGHTMVPET
ncbi:hypothetical protein BDQ17DRAFT_1421073 [Cyathus striatus]|nr:hypothetical protein BDQ17DRAFT_1421073 [Cyathus striatus]